MKIAKGFFATLSPDVALLTYYKGVTVEEFFRQNRPLFNFEMKSDGSHQQETKELILPSKL
jgi:hypothetical protein